MLGKLIKASREKLGITQTDVAKKLKITPQFLSNIEREQCDIPIEYIPKLTKILKLNKHVVIDSMLNAYKENLEKKLKSLKD